MHEVILESHGSRKCSGQDLRELLLPRLFAPRKINNPQWHRCPLGFPLDAIGLFLRTEEVASPGENATPTVLIPKAAPTDSTNFTGAPIGGRVREADRAQRAAQEQC
jgi:hypothetical protein